MTNKEDKIADFNKAYLTAVDTPPIELSQTFQEEAILLEHMISFTPPYSAIIELGCGVRPIQQLAEFFPTKRFIGVDNNAQILDEVKKRRRIGYFENSFENLSYILADATNTRLQDRISGLTYSTYNLIGSILPENMHKLIAEKSRLTQSDGLIMTITWSNDPFTQEFQKKYYPYIGAKISSIDGEKTTTSVGTFYRVPSEKIIELYEANGIEYTNQVKINEIWTCVIGRKRWRR